MSTPSRHPETIVQHSGHRKDDHIDDIVAALPLALDKAWSI